MGRYNEQVPSGAAFWGVSDLVAHFWGHKRVQELALHQLRNRNGDLNTVARVCGRNGEVRSELLRLGNPLPAYLRLIVVDRLGRLASEDDFAHEVLADFDEDIDGNVKTAGAIGFARSVKRRGPVPCELLEELAKRLRVIGPDLRERRQAGFAALLEVERLDIVEDVWSKEEPGDLGLGDRSDTNLRFAETVGRQLKRVSGLFGGEFWSRTGWVSEEFLGGVAAHSTSPDLVERVIDLVSGEDQETSGGTLLQLYSRQWRGTPRLRELCLTLVGGFSVRRWVDTAPGLYAAEVLAEQFSSDTRASDVLDALVAEGRISSALIVALGTGWREAEAWRALSERAELEKLLLPARLTLIAANATPEEFVVQVGEVISARRGEIWDFLPLCSRVVASRFRRDQKVRELAFLRLGAEATSFEKVNFPFFLLETDEKGEELRRWMRSEVGRQSDRARFPEVALDLSTGTVRSVCQVFVQQLIA